MIGVLVRFRYDADFDEQRIRKAAQTAQSRFVGLPGLRSKAFTRTAYRKRERSRPGSDSWTSSVRFGPILLKNSPPKFGRKNYGHEKSITMEFLSATTFKTTLVVKRFLKKGTFLSAERAERVFQQNRPIPDAQVVKRGKQRQRVSRCATVCAAGAPCRNGIPRRGPAARYCRGA